LQHISAQFEIPWETLSPRLGMAGTKNSIQRIHFRSLVPEHTVYILILLPKFEVLFFMTSSSSYSPWETLCPKPSLARTKNSTQRIHLRSLVAERKCICARVMSNIAFPGHLTTKGEKQKLKTANVCAYLQKCANAFAHSIHIL
jgi:hypothetical protein